MDEAARQRESVTRDPSWPLGAALLRSDRPDRVDLGLACRGFRHIRQERA